MTETLKRSRAGHLGTITRTENSAKGILDKDPAILTRLEVSNVKCCLKRCEDQASKIKELDNQILDGMQEVQASADDIEAEQAQIDENSLRIEILIEALRNILEERAAESSTMSDDEPERTPPDETRRAASGLKLPKLSLPTFNGKYADWIPFIDLFRNTVDSNTTLSPIQKLHYLKSSLKDEPAKLLSRLPTTGANYEVALRLLEKRYSSKRLTVHTHLEAILEFRPIKEESAEQLRKLVNVYLENSMALQALGLDTGASDFIWVHIISKKLDKESRRQWELQSRGDDIQSMDELQDFLEERARALEASSPRNPKRQEFPRVQGYQSSHGETQMSPLSQGHKLYQCDKFKALAVEDRRSFVKSAKLCFNCMRLGHNSKTCKSKSRCQKCEQPHHTMLHFYNSTTEQSSLVNAHLIRKGEAQSRTFLPTVEIDVLSQDGHYKRCRALLDSGSECSFISEDCIQRLQIKREKSDVVVSGIGGSSKASNRGKVNLKLFDKNSNSHEVTAYILPRLTNAIPSNPLTSDELSKFPNINLSDKSYTKSSNIDIILGVDIYERVIGNERIEVSKGLFARKTVFGWTICGSTSTGTKRKVNSFQSTVDFDLKQFWELEETPTAPKLSKEEEECEKHFSLTTKIEDNRYVVKLKTFQL